MAKKIRATTSEENPEVGKLKNQDYKFAANKAKAAYEADFYLEHITLYESMIADRLESRLNNNGITDKDFSSLKILIDAMNSCEKDIDIKNVVSKVDIWREKRNTALHEIAKREAENTKTAVEKYEECKAIAEEGKKLFEALSSQIKKVKRAEEKSKVPKV